MTQQDEKPSVIPPAPATAPDALPDKKPPTLKEFLEKCAPDVQMVVTQRASGPHPGGAHSRQTYFSLDAPELDLHCENCGGTRAFKSINQYTATLSKGLAFGELDYQCKNCKEGNKFRRRFCLALLSEGKTGAVQKIGEYPTYSPVTSRKVYDLIGENHRELFLKGRRAELRGLGIGAFAYYRRIVEDQKAFIIDQLEKVAKRLRYRLMYSKYSLVLERRTGSQMQLSKLKMLFRRRSSSVGTIRSSFCIAF